ncbi:MAG: hypothetical protein APR63_03885 [Desulfuromonas sp. SDB]|nr:MAG: hypothetical protein APR63_03885 [Desulfuromonas sp. SDB]
MNVENTRKPDYHVDCMFIDRWSPRSFVNSQLDSEILNSLFEAARWAPSCYNEQPWLFVFSTNEQEKEKLLDTLLPGNRTWNKNVPVIAYIMARKKFSKNNKSNFHAMFDTGAAWMSLALQARKLGLYTHAMAGFDRKKVYQLLNLEPQEIEVIAALAIGYEDEPEKLDAKLQKMEYPNQRKSIENFSFSLSSFQQGGFKLTGTE